MSRIVGVIAEYNPFHHGHAHQLRAAREAAKADYVVVVMSACFTQRGDAALLSPHTRAQMALACGADAVFALPAAWSVRDAERFALGGVSALHALGCDAISFGSESADAEPLMAAAQLLEAPEATFRQRLAEQVASGVPYPAALAASADLAVPGTGALLSQPNSTLAVCYLRAIIRLGAQLEVCPIPRTGDYHATSLDGAPPSATALRGAILRGDWRSAEAAMPPKAFAILMEHASQSHLHRPGALDTALLARLRTMSTDEYAALPDASEGIEQRLCMAAQSACTRESLLHIAKTRRYPFARLSRMATHALLGITHQALEEQPLYNTPWLLGFRQECRPLISRLSAHAHLLTRAGDLTSAPWFPIERRAWDLWALGAGLPAGMASETRLLTL